MGKKKRTRVLRQECKNEALSFTLTKEADELTHQPLLCGYMDQTAMAQRRKAVLK